MRWFLAVVLACLTTPLAAQDSAPPTAPPDVEVRQSVEPASGAVIGQHVALRVDVLFRGDMPRPPRVSLPDIPGLQVLRFETQGTTIRETLSGVPYMGQRFEFALYARRGGTFEIGPASVTLLDPQGGVTGTAQGQIVALAVDVPAGVDPSGPVVATRDLTLDEHWAPAPQGPLKAGDAIVRTIMRSAQDVPGLAMRDLAFPTPEGVRTYVDPPDISDTSNRGLVTGRRTDRVTYLFERGGHFTLPPVTQPWWDLASGTLRTADAKGIALDVTAPPPPPETAGGGTSIRALALGAIAAAVVALLAFAMLRRRSLSSPATAERDAFNALRHACSRTDTGATYRALAVWRRLLEPDTKRQADMAAGSLDQALFGDDPPSWDMEKSQSLIRRLAGLRRSHPMSERAAALPPLNP